MVLTSDGEILTNNHVIDGATTIKVTVVSTGKTYTAKVVGTAPTKDIAVLKLQNASGLQTANLGDSSTVVGRRRGDRRRQRRRHRRHAERGQRQGDRAQQDDHRLRRERRRTPRRCTA